MLCPPKYYRQGDVDRQLSVHLAQPHTNFGMKQREYILTLSGITDFGSTRALMMGVGDAVTTMYTASVMCMSHATDNMSTLSGLIDTASVMCVSLATNKMPALSGQVRQNDVTNNMSKLSGLVDKVMPASSQTVKPRCTSLSLLKALDLMTTATGYL